jgi:hypothetical protein
VQRSRVPARATTNDDDIELLGQSDTSSPIVAAPRRLTFSLMTLGM